MNTQLVGDKSIPTREVDFQKPPYGGTRGAKNLGR